MANYYDDIDPMDIDPETGRPYAGYSSPSLDTSFHDAEMDVDDGQDSATDIPWWRHSSLGNGRGPSDD